MPPSKSKATGRKYKKRYVAKNKITNILPPVNTAPTNTISEHSPAALTFAPPAEASTSSLDVKAGRNETNSKAVISLDDLVVSTAELRASKMLKVNQRNRLKSQLKPISKNGTKARLSSAVTMDTEADDQNTKDNTYSGVDNPFSPLVNDEEDDTQLTQFIASLKSRKSAEKEKHPPEHQPQQNKPESQQQQNNSQANINQKQGQTNVKNP